MCYTKNQNWSLLALLLIASLSVYGHGPRNKSASSQNELKAVFAKFARSLVARGAHVGVMVAKTDGGQTLFEHQPDELINPASNMKLLTSLAALHNMRPEYKFRTEYFARGPISNGILQGDLVVKGYGDPSIVTETLQKVAKELWLRGITQISGDIILDDSYFDNDFEPKGWGQDESDHAFAAPIGALSLDFNSVRIFIRPTVAGQKAFVALDPAVEYVNLQASVKTTKKGNGIRIGSSKGSDKTNVLVEGNVGEHLGNVQYYRRVFNPTLYFGSGLAQFLKEQGIKSHKVRIGSISAQDRLIFRDYSRPLGEIVADMNKFSNNFIAEMLLKNLGAKNWGEGTTANGLKAIESFLELEVGISPDRYVMGNGSGLNRASRLSARQLVQLLCYANRNFSLAPEFAASLSVAGTQGTISKRMRHTAAEGVLRAKTGTLNQVSSLSGYVESKDGQVLAFAILTQGLQNKARKLQDELGKAMAKLDVRDLPQLAMEKGL